jgi:regulator of replication initiation timing
VNNDEEQWKEAARSEAEEVNRLQAENKKLRQALEFYADIRFWEKCNQTHYTNYNRDKEKLGLMWYGGRKAREALKEVVGG